MHIYKKKKTSLPIKTSPNIGFSTLFTIFSPLLGAYTRKTTFILFSNIFLFIFYSFVWASSTLIQISVILQHTHSWILIILFPHYLKAIFLTSVFQKCDYFQLFHFKLKYPYMDQDKDNYLAYKPLKTDTSIPDFILFITKTNWYQNSHYL